MTVETRYLQNATQVVNTKTVHKLLVTPVALSKTDSKTLCAVALDSTLYPTSDSSIQWTRSAGATNYGCIDEVVADDADYVSCNVYDKTDKYGHTAFTLAAGKKIARVVMNIRYICKSPLRVGFEIGGVAYYNTVAVAAAFQVRTSVFELDPSTNQEWTQAGLNAALMYVRSLSFEPYTDYVSWFNISVYTYTDYTAEWAFQVWKLAADGTETELTAGKTTVFTSLVSDFHNAGLSASPVEYSVNWVCPLTALVATDAVEMAMYVKNSAGTWLLHSTWKFGTAQLGAGSLDSATWTLYFWLYSQSTTTTMVSWHVWGTVANDGRIENFTWTAAAVGKLWMALKGRGGDARQRLNAQKTLKKFLFVDFRSWMC